MQILGEKGLGNILKVILQIFLCIVSLVLIALPFVLQIFGLNLGASIFIIYPNGIVLLLIANKFMKLFDSLKNNKPFCENNVKILKSTGKTAFIGACFWMMDLLYEIVFAEKLDVICILVMTFLFILYIGVSIALYILSELFKQATEYKNENELTI
ncbi:MAG: DUF2975 domain-containing protein [Clostridia bacterium]|nr:DUF2975 domain-containing protein [Clostridia bacterium]